MSLPVFLVIETKHNPHHREACERYISQVFPLIKAYGGVPIATYDVEEAIHHNDKPSAFDVISFPNKGAIHDLFNAPSYKALEPLRDLGHQTIRHFITTEKI